MKIKIHKLVCSDPTSWLTQLNKVEFGLVRLTSGFPQFENEKRKTKIPAPFCFPGQGNFPIKMQIRISDVSQASVMVFSCPRNLCSQNWLMALFQLFGPCTFFSNHTLTLLQIFYLPQKENTSLHQRFLKDRDTCKHKFFPHCLIGWWE